MPFMSFMNQYPLLLQTLGLGLPAEFLIMSAVFRRWRWNLKYPHSHASNTFHFQCLPKGSTLCKHTFKGQHTHSDGDNVYHWKSGNVWQRRANVKMTTQRPELAPEGLFGSKWIIPVMQYYFILNSLISRDENPSSRWFYLHVILFYVFHYFWGKYRGKKWVKECLPLCWSLK